MRNLIFFFFLLSTSFLFAQSEKDSSLVQFSGVVVDGAQEQLYPIQFANLFIRKKGVGTYTDSKGFFSIVVEKGDIVEISSIGYQTVTFQIPDTLVDNRYSLVQLMTQDTVNLPETIVFPWPSRENFRLEFLAMDVTEELQALAAKNVAKKALNQIKDQVPWDGNENADFYMREQAKSYYYSGQTPPMNIFSPLAWQKFFKSWKNGDFKKKKSNQD